MYQSLMYEGKRCTITKVLKANDIVLFRCRGQDNEQMLPKDEFVRQYQLVEP